MWERIKSLFIVMHKSSRNEAQQKQARRLLLAGEIIVELFMLLNVIVDFPRHSFVIQVRLIVYLVIYLIGIILTILIKNPIVPSVIFDLAFLYGFSMTFMYGTYDIFGSLWMIVVTPLSMYILSFAVSFWTCVVYFLIVTFLTFYQPTRYMLSVRYSEVFLSRYYIIYFIDLLISTIAMMQLHVMRYNQNRNLERLEEAVKAEHDKVTSISMQTILAINNAVQAKDTYTGQHSQRVSHFACLIAQKLGWAEDDINELRTIALLHDIGKIGVDEDILNKPSRLTDDEYVQMKQHTVMGGSILKDLTLIPNVDLGATFHHERYDGRGYPEGISGEDIPIEARIIGIADTFDAMNFSRIYRPRCDLDYVKGELQKGRGTQFDPELLDIFVQVCEENNWFRDFNIEDVSTEV